MAFRSDILHDEQYKNIIIVSKAGGFGGEDAIFRVLNFFKNAW